jgi:hypothetical protein
MRNKDVLELQFTAILTHVPLDEVLRCLAKACQQLSGIPAYQEANTFRRGWDKAALDINTLASRMNVARPLETEMPIPFQSLSRIDRFRALLRYHRLTDQQAADILFCTRSHINMLRNGRAKVTDDHIAKLLESLGDMEEGVVL